ncbi:DUF397 domain-containing protein [Nocardia yunnanensis]|uniref:DUF397 domain-containing protein n=1 Tax=Nocardia yunnanensis TaxID=2382165 RepID=A0A386ZK49_9NOCA|nr:DUF397 domain-containing protein [Nocardia yunnanensis]AYF77524.1 DUF397 domain-containing protein [Nocardia yunnanensis]
MSTARQGAQWYKSSRSANQDACVEVAHWALETGVRDSKNPGGPELMFPADEWAAFDSAVRAGKFDLG